MPTAAQLDRKARRQLRRVAGRGRDAADRAARKVADARSHAVKALTEALADAPEGRPAIGRIRGSRSYRAAQGRLAELLDDLAGPRDDSLDGLIRDARAAMLAEAMAAWAKLLPPEAVRPDPTPTQAELRAIRRHEAHGLTLRQEIGPRVETAGRALQAAVHQASRRDLGDRLAATVLDTWEARTSRAIATAATLALSDSAVIADTAAQWLVLRPELRGDGPGPIEV